MTDRYRNPKGHTFAVIHRIREGGNRKTEDERQGILEAMYRILILRQNKR